MAHLHQVGTADSDWGQEDWNPPNPLANPPTGDDWDAVRQAQAALLNHDPANWAPSPPPLTAAQLAQIEQDRIAREDASDVARDAQVTRWIDSEHELLSLLAQLEQCGGVVPDVVVDCEGFNYYRLECDVMEIYHIPSKVLYLIDVNGLTGDCFDMRTLTGFTLKKFLESPTQLKLFYDCRMDSRALYQSYDINLKGVFDLSLMMTKWRMRRKGNDQAHRVGVDTVVDELHEKDVITYNDTRAYSRSKGGIRQSEAWARRPLDPLMIAYSQDLRIMATLFQYLQGSFYGTPDWADIIDKSWHDVAFGRSFRFSGRKTEESPWSIGYYDDNRDARCLREVWHDFRAEIRMRRLNGHAMQLSRYARRPWYHLYNRQIIALILSIMVVAGAIALSLWMRRHSRD